MGLLRRIVDRFDPAETRAEPSWEHLSGLNTATGSLFGTRMAENLSTVLACVNAISGGVASLPVYAYRETGERRIVDPSHGVMALYRNGPNPWQTWPDFAEFLIASTLLAGNGLAEIVTDNAGRVVELRPIPWEWVSVVMLPTGRLAYDVTEITSLYGGDGRSRRLLQHEVVHLKDRSDDGLIGKSRLSRARSVVSAGLEIQNYAEAMFGNQATPSGTIEADGKIDEDAMDKLRRQFEKAYTGSSNARKAMILDQGLKFRPISVSPEDAELLASRRFTVEELARLYQVPPPIIGDLTNGTFTNAETVGRWFAQQTLSGWVRKIEAEFNRRVMGADHKLEIDLSGMLRGDPEQRWASHKIAVDSGILTANEVREVEGYAPTPDGNSLGATA